MYVFDSYPKSIVKMAKAVQQPSKADVSDKNLWCFPPPSHPREPFIIHPDDKKEKKT